MLKLTMSGLVLGTTLALLGGCETEGGDRTSVVTPGQDGVPALDDMPELAAPGGAGFEAQKWSDCPDGYSCYFLDANGNGPWWKAPSPGWFRFSDSLRDRLSSVRNRGGGVVDLYNCVDHQCSGFVYVNSVGLNTYANLVGSANDVVDIIHIWE
jgi:hypothetical protein